MGSLNVPLLPRLRRVPLTMVRNGVRSIRAEGTSRWPERLPYCRKMSSMWYRPPQLAPERDRLQQRSIESQSNDERRKTTDARAETRGSELLDAPLVARTITPE